MARVLDRSARSVGRVVLLLGLVLANLVAWWPSPPPARALWRVAQTHARVDAVRGEGAAMLALETSEILPPSPDSQLATFEVPNDALLTTAIGLDPLFSAGAVAIEIAVAKNGTDDWRPLFDGCLSASMAGRWYPLELALSSSSFPAGTYRFRFSKRFVPEREAPPPEELRPSELLFWRSPQVRQRRPLGSPNIVLISLDALRADHLGFMGYRRRTSPVLDRVAAEGLTFRLAIAQAPWTTPSHFTMLTGAYPRHHGADRVARRPRENPIPMLSEVLRRRGYVTAAFTGRGRISAEYGFYQGFDSYDETEGIGPCATDIEPIVEKSIRWLRHHRDRTFFLFVHSYEPHAPFCGNPFFVDQERLREETNGPTELRSAYYDGNILKADTFTGRLVDAIHDLGLWERSIVVVTSDHGTDLGGRNPPQAVLQFGHGYNLFDEALHVPLVVTGGAVTGRPRQIREQVRLVDLVPTLLAWVGADSVAGLDGRSLLPLVRGAEVNDRPALSEATCFGTPRESLRVPPFKYVHRLSPTVIDAPGSAGLPPSPPVEVYDLRRDPGELRNLAEHRPRRVAELHQQLRAVGGDAPGTGAAGQDQTMDPGPIEVLRTLGYVQ